MHDATLLELAARWANAARTAGFYEALGINNNSKKYEEVHREIFEDALRVRTQQHAMAIK